MHARNSRGFTALITAVIVSALLFTAVVATSGASFLTRFSILTSEFKEKSEFRAEACVQHAILSIFRDPLYTATNVVIPIAGELACRLAHVLPDTPATGQTTIEAQGESNETYTNLRVIVNTVTQDVLSSTEVPNF